MNKCNCHSNGRTHVPSVVSVQTTDSIGRFANSFVYVLSNNTTYFVNSCREVTIISSGPVFVNNYNAVTNPLSLANQVCYDFANNIAYAFDASGAYRTFELKEVA